MTPQLVDEADLATANSLNSLIENLSVIVGPAIGARILAVSTTTTTFLFNAATFAFSAFASSRVRARSVPTDVTEGGEAGALKQVAVGFKAIGSSSTATILVAASVVASFMYGTDTVLFVVVSQERLGVGPDGFGMLLAGLGVGGMLMAPLVDRLAKRPRLGWVISVGLIVFVMPTLALVWVTNPVVAFGLQIIRGGGTLVVDVLAVTALQRSLAPDLIARVFGVFMSLVLAAISLGALVTPPLLRLVGLDGTLVAFSAVTAALVVVAWPWTRNVDREGMARLEVLAPRIAALESLGIFAAANRTALERLAGATDEVTMPPGTRIIEQGEPADYLYVIMSGRVAVTARAEADPFGVSVPEVPLRTLGQGQYFGEIGLIEKIPRTANVTATTTATLLRIPGEDFVDGLSSNASVAFLEGARLRLARTRELTQMPSPETTIVLPELAAQKSGPTGASSGT